MTVQVTNAFRTRLQEFGINVDVYTAMFSEFKSGDPLDHLIFGKDSAYKTPEVAGQIYTLRHVHVMPVADPVQNAAWRELARKKAEKVSDRALVYVTDAGNNHLIIYLLEEPEAHTIARMGTEEHKLLMTKFAAIAAEFLKSGKVIG